MAIQTRAQKKGAQERQAVEETHRRDRRTAISDEQGHVEDAHREEFRRSSSSLRSSEPDRGIPISRWRGTPLPEFDIPRWRKKAGVPTVVLKPIDVHTRLIPTNNPEGTPEDVQIEDGSDYSSISEDSDAPASEFTEDDPQAENGQTIDQGRRRNFPGREEDGQDSVDSDEDMRLFDEVDVSSLEVEGLSNDANVNDREFEKWGENLTKFVRSPFGPEGFLGAGWHGVKPLGRGGFAMAAVWERRNEDNDIVDKVVIKQIGKEKPRERGAFVKEKEWDDRYPLEVELMRALKNKNNIVQIRGYRRYRQKEVHRIYMEYCSSGDLYGLISQYRARRQYMPEALICHLFLHLARACQSLTEPISPKTDPVKYNGPSKNEIIHMDIKPRNVFLGDLDNGQDKTGISYPEVKLGDYGVGRFTGPDDENNPWGYRGSGTEGYKPLEMENFSSKNLWEKFEHWPHIERAKARYEKIENSMEGILQLYSFQILSSANIWGIGAVMFEVMTLKQAKNYFWQIKIPDDAAEGEYDDQVERNNVQDGLRNTPYKRALQNIVQKCLADFPEQRPRIPALITALEEFIASRKEDWRTTPDQTDEENPLPQQIPFENFPGLPLGDWESSELQSAYYPPKSSFTPTPGEKRRLDEDRPERHKRRKLLQQHRNEERKIRRERGDQDVESDEVGSPPDTPQRQYARAKKREGTWWEYVREKWNGKEPRGYT
ncbi:MAG: hypothetical protein Q9176_002544 [Flavoplaca citrina]